jgi:peptide/nickel transport system substrate-binding protein
MKRLFFSLLVIALIFALVLPACAPTEQVTPPPAEEEEEVSPPSEPAGTLVWATSVLGEEYWSPKLSYTAYAYLMGTVWEGLVRRSVDGKNIGALAESWERTSDGLTYTFHLRQGVQWHEGWGEFTADDVKFTMEELVLAEDSANVRFGYFDENVESLEIVDKYTIKFHMTAPDWTLPYWLNDRQQPFPVMCKEYFETVGFDAAHQHPVGTGPFRFIEHEMGDYVKFEAVENHWRLTPDYKYLIIKKVPDMATQVSMLAAGEIDGSEITPDFASEVESISGARVMAVPKMEAELYLMGLYLLPGEKGYDPTVPWAQPDQEKARKVRHAMSYAIDRQALVDYTLNSYGEVTYTNVYFSLADPALDPSWEPWPYDPDKAKQLLAEAGYPDPSEIKVTMQLAQHQDTPNVVMMEAIGHMWEDIGVTVEYETLDLVTWLGKCREHELAGTAVAFCSLPYPEAPMYMKSVVHSSAGLHFGPHTEEIDALIDAHMAEIDDTKRDEISHQLGQLFYEEQYVPALCFVSQLVALGPKVKSWEQYNPYVYNSLVCLEYIKLVHD